MVKILRTIAAVSAVVSVTLAPAAFAQSASGQSATSCSQSGNEVTCTTTTKFTIPAGVNLSSSTNSQGNFQLSGGGPGCSNPIANPSTMQANAQTNVSLSIAGCTAGSTYAWQVPAADTGLSTSSASVTLNSTNTSQQLSVRVCLPGATTSPGCQTYSTTVSLAGQVPALSGCAISPAGTTNITTSGSTTLSVSCSQGTGVGSGVAYAWFRNNAPLTTETGSSITASGAALGVGTFNYSVQVTNSTTTSPVSLAATVSVQQAQIGDFSQCGNVTSAARSFVVGTSAFTQWYSSGHPGSTPYVVQVDVPANAASLADTQIYFAFGPYSGSGNRQLSISQTPCNWSSLFPLAGGTTVNISVDPNVLPSPRGVILTPGRWYFSFRSTPSNGSNITCGSSQTCAMNMQWQP